MVTTVGVVAKEAPVMALSVAAGRPVECDRCDTFADGMAVRVAVPLAVDELVRLGVRMVEVSERALAPGGRRLRRGRHPRGGLGGGGARGAGRSWMTWMGRWC